ncbi:hypothetical protein EDD18DRAFT_1102703 [Armillaria luteobubalina]|uniref:Uncharacterized protein n=1 Tax=Armillaria luteobubalina TaxID=153913 RepID=A0AA39QAJ9_9AGAR|nr:hypothetical protein EDD18DRAFT_1102703 [Armillaria luteobubalina]
MWTVEALVIEALVYRRHKYLRSVPKLPSGFLDLAVRFLLLNRLGHAGYGLYGPMDNKLHLRSRISSDAPKILKGGSLRYLNEVDRETRTNVIWSCFESSRPSCGSSTAVANHQAVDYCSDLFAECRSQPFSLSRSCCRSKMIRDTGIGRLIPNGGTSVEKTVEVLPFHHHPLAGRASYSAAK